MLESGLEEGGFQGNWTFALLYCRTTSAGEMELDLCSVREPLLRDEIELMSKSIMLLSRMYASVSCFQVRMFLSRASKFFIFYFSYLSLSCVSKIK